MILTSQEALPSTQLHGGAKVATHKLLENTQIIILVSGQGTGRTWKRLSGHGAPQGSWSSCHQWSLQEIGGQRKEEGVVVISPSSVQLQHLGILSLKLLGPGREEQHSFL